jgi:hypothetical protein
LHPETKHGGDRKSDQVANSATRFTANTADATGKSERAVQIAAARGEALGDDLGAVTGTSLDKGVEREARERTLFLKIEGKKARPLLTGRIFVDALPFDDIYDRSIW